MSRVCLEGRGGAHSNARSEPLVRGALLARFVRFATPSHQPNENQPQRCVNRGLNASPEAQERRALPAWPEGRRIAIVNWRDPDHPQAGGAEVYCSEVARWLAQAGAEVTLVTARAPGQDRQSKRDGVRIHRTGGRFSVYPRALLWLRRHRRQIDAVLDCQNGIPFFAPIAVGRRVPVVMLMHHVHQEQFALHFGARLAGIGRFLEGPASRLAYRGRPVIAVSPSTRAEIRTLLRLPAPIYVVPNGVSIPEPGTRHPTREPSIVSVGRLVVQKGLHHAIDAVAEARQTLPGLRFHIVGDGPELTRLRQQVQRLGLQDAVLIHGRVTDADRDLRLSQSWIFLSASQREGWGVAVLEAAAHGVPAIAYDVPGLRDAVRHEATGWLVSPEDSLAETLALAVHRLREPGELEAMASRCRDWSANFGWARTGRRVSELLRSESERLLTGRPTREPLDLVTRVEITADRAAKWVRHPLQGQRLTDDWRWTPTRLIGLLYGTDEVGADRALERLGLDSDAAVSVALTHDLLGDLPDEPPSSAAAKLDEAPPADGRTED
jgi:glycosyltransferase involved in cell wall biosynthesis